jgi:ubiquinone/menaquinone biosynthesis C-methylase UbiE
MPFSDNSYDLVFLIEVLEHVHNPQKALSEIYRVLKPGGTLIFSVPFINLFIRSDALTTGYAGNAKKHVINV